jgi:hypothetical protein
MSIALLLVLPTSEASFRSRISTSDYLSRYKLDPDTSWRVECKNDVAALRELVETALSVGASVIEDATLADLSRATKEFETVVLFSHWKGPTILLGGGEDDDDHDLLSKNPTDYVEMAGTATSKSAVWLQRAFSATPPRDREGVHEILTTYINSRGVWSEQGDDDFELVANDFTIESWNRDELDRLFGSLINPGNRVEFADGLYDKESIAEVIDAAFNGILDLTTCTSTILSDYLGRVSRGRYATVQFDKEQKPVPACLLLGRTFQLFGEGLSYRAARIKALKDLKQTLEEFDAKERSKGFFGVFSRFMGKQ